MWCIFLLYSHCDGLKNNGPHRLLSLSSYSSENITVWGLVVWACWRKCVPRRELWGFRSSLSFQLLVLAMFPEPSLPTAMFPTVMLMDYVSETVRSQINVFLCKSTHHSDVLFTAIKRWLRQSYILKQN